MEFRVGKDAPAYPVAENPWLKNTGMLPLGADPGSSADPNYDVRAPGDGGCDSPSHFEGCHVYYIKVRTIWASYSENSGSMQADIFNYPNNGDLIVFRYAYLRYQYHIATARL